MLDSYKRGPNFYPISYKLLTIRGVTLLHRKVDFAWESDFLQRKAYYLQIQLVNRIISSIYN